MLGLENLLIYKYNDMAVVLVRGLEIFSSRDFFPTIENAGIVEGINPVSRFIEDLFFKAFPPVLSANLIFLVYFFLAIAFSYFFFYILSKEKAISFVFSLLYSTSIYFLYRLISFTPGLYLIFIFPLLIYLLHVKKVKPFFLGLFVSLLFAYTSYYAFFAFLLVVFWYISDFAFNEGDLSFKLNNLLKSIILFIVPLVFVITLLFAPLIIRSLPVFSKYRPISLEESSEHTYRSIEDWYDFSFRPWYLVIPPKASLYFGDLSSEIHQRIKATSYYLADDYEETEMAGSYMGWHFIIGVIVAAILVFANRGMRELSNNRVLIKKSILVILLILLISLPPSLTILGFTVYTPTYLMYYLFPVFRVLVRLSIVVYLLVLVINFFLFLDLYSLMKSKIQKLTLLLVFVALNYFIFGINLPVVDVSNPPPEVSFLKDLPDESASIAVYPNANHKDIFWVLSHKKSLINPMDLVNYEIGFNSNEFSEELVTVEGLEKLKELGGDYLLVYKNRVIGDRLVGINKLNSSIIDYGDLESFYRRNFGEVVYEDDRSVVFKSAHKTF